MHLPLETSYPLHIRNHRQAFEGLLQSGIINVISFYKVLPSKFFKHLNIPAWS